MKDLRLAFCEVFASPSAWIIGVVSFFSFLAIYLMTLPATFTGGAIGLIALRFLTPELVGWAVLMAALLSLVMPMTIYLLRRGYKSRGGAGIAAGGLAISLITPLLCCSPILPILFSFLAGFLPVLAGGAGGAVQGFLATHEWLFFTVATSILMFALYKNVKEVVKGACCTI
jgi:hypothetical protein